MEIEKVRAKVHMLPTEDIENYPLYIHDKGYLIEGKYRVGEPSGTQKHLYFTTDEKIVEGDWVVCLDEIDSTVQNWSVSQAVFKYNNGGNCNSDMKIVATTDTSLSLPHPSQAFIQKYCELGGIDEVDIELKSSDLDYFFGDLKVDPIHNTVTIHSIKDSWNREEVEKLLELAWATASAYGDKTDSKDCKDWMRHNL